MSVSLKSISVTLTSVGVSLTPTTTQLAWGADSESLLLGVSIPGSTTGGSTVVASYVPTYPYFGF